MRFAFIVPIAHLREAKMSDFHLCLAHLLHHKEYFDFYKECVESGEYVILDNGTVEVGEPYPDEKLYELVRELQPAEVVAPDFLGDTQRTIDATKAFVANFPPELKTHTRIMTPIQGKTLGAMMECYEAIRGLGDVIGVPFSCDFEGHGAASFMSVSELRSKARLSLISWLRRVHSGPIHCLGMNSVGEAIAVSKIPIVRSMDSSFVWTQTNVVREFWTRREIYKNTMVTYDPYEEKDSDFVRAFKRNAYYIKALVGDVQ